MDEKSLSTDRPEPANENPSTSDIVRLTQRIRELEMSVRVQNRWLKYLVQQLAKHKIASNERK